MHVVVHAHMTPFPLVAGFPHDIHPHQTPTSSGMYQEKGAEREGKSGRVLLVILRPVNFPAFVRSSRVITLAHTLQVRLVLVPLLESVDPFSRDRCRYSCSVKLHDMVCGIVVCARHLIRAEPSPHKFPHRLMLVVEAAFVH